MIMVYNSCKPSNLGVHFIFHKTESSLAKTSFLYIENLCIYVFPFHLRVLVQHGGQW